MQSPFHKPVMALLCWAILLLSACRAETPRPPQKSPEQIERERQRAAREAAEIEAEARAEADSLFRAATGQEPPRAAGRPDAEASAPATLQATEGLEIPVYQSSRGGHKYFILRHIRSKPLCILQRYGKILQIPVVHTDNPRIDLHGTLNFFLIVGLHKHIQLQFSGQLVKIMHLHIIQNGCDEQHRIGPDGFCLIELVLIDHKVLSQDGKCRHLPDCFNICIEDRATPFLI